LNRENQRRTKGENIKSKLKQVFAADGYSDRLRLPPGCGGPSQTVLTGMTMAEFDGCTGLVSYEDTHVTLRLSDKTVTVYGQHLTLKSFSEDHIAVCGRVYGVLEGECRKELAFADH